MEERGGEEMREKGQAIDEKCIRDYVCNELPCEWLPNKIAG